MSTPPPRTFRPSPELWAAAKATAEQRGESVSAVIVRCLERYVVRNRVVTKPDATR